MSMVIVGKCRPSHRYGLIDATTMLEADFENDVAQALMCYENAFICIPFHGSFRFENQTHRADLALVARDFSHWFVVEVELTSHSLHGHVVPQVRAFRYGEPQRDCIESLAQGANLDRAHAELVISDVPRSVLVAANRWSVEWENALRAVDVGLVAVSIYGSPDGERAYEVSGTLEVPIAGLGWGTYSATDRAIIFARSIGLQAGVVQIEDVETGHALWKVIHEDVRTWVVRESGEPSLLHGEQVQLLRTLKGSVLLRRSSRSLAR